jgi:hypothetical protein
MQPMARAASLWASGPGEILQHALSLLKKDSDVNRRLAMILIDNAVELMVKTFLGLPKRVTGIQIGRDKLREINESFPRLLDALEQHAAPKVAGIDLGEVEWFHRLRNELYHQGNGLTVERAKVDVYSEMARLLFRRLFDEDLPLPETSSTELLGAFMSAWARLEKASGGAAGTTGIRHRLPVQVLRNLERRGFLSAPAIREFDRLRHLRNQVVHGEAAEGVLTPDLVHQIELIAMEVENAARGSP